MAQSRLSEYLEIGKIVKEKLIEQKQMELSEEEKARYTKLKKHVTYDVLKEKYKTSNFDIKIDGFDYSIPIMDLLSILELSEEDFINLCNNKEIKTINNIKKQLSEIAKPDATNKIADFVISVSKKPDSV